MGLSILPCEAPTRSGVNLHRLTTLRSEGGLLVSRRLSATATSELLPHGVLLTKPIRPTPRVEPKLDPGVDLSTGNRPQVRAEPSAVNSPIRGRPTTVSHRYPRHSEPGVLSWWSTGWR
jgi:hypothetical protein